MMTLQELGRNFTDSGNAARCHRYDYAVRSRLHCLPSEEAAANTLVVYMEMAHGPIGADCVCHESPVTREYPVTADCFERFERMLSGQREER